MGAEDPEPEAAAADAVGTKEEIAESGPPAENAEENTQPAANVEESVDAAANVEGSVASTANAEDEKLPTENTEDNVSGTENAEDETSPESPGSSSKLDHAEEPTSEFVPQPDDVPNVPFSDIDIIPYLQELEDQQEEVEEEEIRYHYIEMLDAPRELAPPVELTLKDLTHIANELGLIKLCWPEIEYPEFENRVNFPESYLTNSNKEKLLLLYTENFRRQFCHKYPNRKQLFLASANECGMQKMVCTTIRPTTLPYPEIETWEDCAKFVGQALKFEPFDIPTLIVSKSVVVC